MSRRALVIASAALGVVLLVSGVLWGPTAWHVLREKNPTLATPDAVAGLTRDTSEHGVETATSIRDALSVGTAFDKTVAAVYTDPASTDRSVIVFAGSAILTDPGSELDELFGSMSDKQGGVTGVTKIDAGTLGGEARCGLTQIDQDQVTVCGWADHGSAAVMLFPKRTVAESTKLFLPLREAMQKR